MTLPSKFYEILKFLVTLVPYVVTIVSGLLLGLGVADKTTSVVTLCIGAVGSVANAIVKTCAANHWKKINADGTTEEIVTEEEN